MKKIITILLFATAALYGVACEDATGDARITSIERTIPWFRDVVSNDIATASYDFRAIIAEIKCIASEAERLRLIERLIAPLFDAQDDQWKTSMPTRMAFEKDHLLRLAFESLTEDKYIMFRWNCHIRRLQSMKKELSLYDDARNPDDVRRDLWPKIEENFKQDVERRRAQSNEKVFVISGSVKLPKE